MKTNAFFLSAIVIISTLGCLDCQQNDSIMPLPTDNVKCAPACEKMKNQLHCAVGEDIVTPLTVDGRCTQGVPDDGPDGGIICRTTCEQWCIETQNKGVFLNPTCVLEQAESCEDIDTLCAINPN